MDESVLLRDALQAGRTRSQMRGPGWTPISHGLYVRREADADLIDRCRHVRPILPWDAACSHLTAARLWSTWLPALPDWLPLQVTIPPGAQRPERAGLYVARSRAALPPPIVVSGVPVLDPALVIGQLAEDLQLIDLVIAIDGFLQQQLCTEDDTWQAIRSRQRGLPMLRRALALVDGRSESRWESVLRLFHVLCKIPVEAQYPIRDADGEVVARADLRIKETRRLPEYDGANHRDRERHRRDLARDKLLARSNWERYGYTSVEILDNPTQILRDAENALGLRHDRTRLEPWLTEVERSSLSQLGYRRLLRRLHRFAKPLRGRGERRLRAAAECGKVDPDKGVSA
ncbi:MAG TPA: hypothetical protein VH419_01330 [Nocardioidaceae bacterium]